MKFTDSFNMRPFFSPAASLVGRMNYTSKFALLSLLFLTAAAVVVHSLYANLDGEISASQRELQGLALIKPITRAVQLLQLHRGLSAVPLDGSETMGDMRAAREREIAGAFKAMENELPSSLSLGEDFQGIKSNWERLRKEGLNLTADDNFAAHTRLIGQLLLFGRATADEFMLVQDPKVGAFYLIDVSINRMPDALERLGQLRGYGTGILARRQITEQQKLNMHRIIAKLDDAFPYLKVDFEKVARHNPVLRNELTAASNTITDSVQQVTGLVESDILTGRFATPPEDFLMMVTAIIDTGYKQVYTSLLPTAEALINQRVAKAKKVLYASIGIALLLFLIAAYFAIGIYYTITDGIKSLAHSAHALAGGDLRARVHLDTRDELSQIGDSFNEMADGFSAILAAHEQAEMSLAKESHKNETLLRTASDGIHILDFEGNVVQMNDAFCRMLGYTEAEMLGMNVVQWDAQWTAAQIKANINSLVGSNATMLETRHRRRDGSIIDVEVSVAKVDVDGQQLVYCSSRDVTERKQAEGKMLHLAHYDALTGLPNRTLFRDRLEQEIRKAHRDGLKMALLFIDLDKFKEVNDTLGHSMGDILLKEAARRIGECLREADTVARLGGDEFTVILGELDHASSVERVTESIRQNLAKPFWLEGETAYVSASIGITLYPDDATGAEDLLKNADQAMYAAKDRGRNGFSYFTQSMQQAAQTKLCLIKELRGALAANQFMLHYQPIVELATGRIDKAEALIRWQHPTLGLVSPAKFIPLAEETGLIVEIGDWVFREAMRRLKQWRTLYNARLQISVNVSPAQFGNGISSPCQAWFGYLRKMELPGQSMNIEITEGLLLDTESGITDKLLEFHNEGVQVAIDDFGTGYSSLSYLKKLDIDYLKIDRSFVRDLMTDPNDMALSGAIIVMAHKLGLKVIAEGVEEEGQRKLLADAGCDYAQGYLFSRPLPDEEFEALLKKMADSSPDRAGDSYLAAPTG
jgi:diguanylate cyclase (GGDEF)-like protein/PAS domain S-box-containing protein